MGEQKEFGQEIVEVYRQPEYREVVEVYSRPLPGAGKEREEALPVPRKSRKKGIIIFAICFVLVVLMAVGAALLAQKKHDFKQSEVGQQKESSGEITIPDFPIGQGVKLPIVREHGEILTAQEIYQQVNPAVVAVLVQREDKMSLGTGVIFREDGYVITNQHVLEGASECMVVLANEYYYPAKYVASDIDNDLGILKIDSELYQDEVTFPVAEFGDSDGLVVGDKVYAIGNPLGFELRGTLTDGIVSAIDRDVWVDNRYMTLIQTNAALNSGNSGGPLINEYGQVVGINVIKMTSKYNNVEGLGFAIPSTYMERIINDLLAYGELQPEPLLGITVLTVAEEVEEGVWGLRVEEVTPGSSGDVAGVRAGDFLLTADGETLSSSQDLLRIRRQHYLGDEMPVTLWRNGEILEVTVVMKDAVEAEEIVPWYLNP
jgi:serine protease Do